MSTRYAAAPRAGVIPGTGPEFPSRFDSDPLLGWCAQCGWPWQPDESKLPPGTAADPYELLAAMRRAPLDRCARCGAGFACVGPAVWAAWLYERLDGDLLGAAYYGRTQLLPTEVYAAWEAGEVTAQQLEWWWSRTSARWRELADNPRARWLDAIHAYGPSFAPLGEMFPQYVDSHDPDACLACQAYGRAEQRDIVAAVAARAMAIWPYVPTDPTDGLWLIRGETARGPYRSRAAAELAAAQLGGRVREARFGCWQPEPAEASRS